MQSFYQIYIRRHREHFKRTWNPKYFGMQVFFYFFALLTFTVSQIYSVTDVWQHHTRTVQMAFGLQVVYVVH